MNIKLQTILSSKKGETEWEWITVDGRERDMRLVKATSTEGHYRFESVDGVQITPQDESGTAQSLLYKDGTPRDFGICDAKDVTFQMKGLFPKDFEVTLFFKIIHFSKESI